MSARWDALQRASGRWGPILAGPLLIAATTLLVLHDFAFLGKLTNQRVDVLRFWLPTHCFLGSSLAAGHVPAWNPHVMGGVPFAADPQSGWMYLPAMLISSVLPCELALGWFIVLQPLIGGVALYWFLRTEGLGRPAATVGGLTLALGMSGSLVVISLPYAGAIAWTAVALAVASRFLRAVTWPGRLAWATLVALAWGQMAAAHLSHGFVIGTLVLGAYVLVRGTGEVRAGRLRRPDALVMLALLVVGFATVNLAYLLPRLAYLPRTSLGLGYDRLQELAIRLSGGSNPLIRPERGTGLSWPLRFVTSPGAYLGAAPLVLSFAGWWSPHRRLVAAFSVAGAFTYLVGLRPVSEGLAPVIGSWPLSDFYLHSPARFVYGAFLVLPILAGFGVEAWRLAGSNRARVAMLLPGVAIWGALPLLVGVSEVRLALAGLGAAVAAPVLLAVRWRPLVLAALPLLVAVELSAAALIGQGAGREVVAAPRTEGLGWREPFVNLLEPTVDGTAYLRAGPVARALVSGGEGRYVSLQPGNPLAYLRRWRPEDGGFLNNQRSMLLGLEDAQGYNPVQLLRYWAFVRAANAVPMGHNWALLSEPAPSILDLLDVRWVVGPADEPLPGGPRPVAYEGPWALYQRRDPHRAFVATHWTVAPGADRALQLVAAGGLDRPAGVVLEADPGIPPAEASPLAAVGYEALGPQRVRLTVDAPVPALVVVRNVYDEGWRATVDGRPSRVLRADYLFQAVPVSPGSHVVELRYEDPWILRGLVGTGMALLFMLGAAVALSGRLRRTAARFDRETRAPGPGTARDGRQDIAPP